MYWSVLVFAVGFGLKKVIFTSMCPLSNKVLTIFPTYAIVEDIIGVSRGL